MRYNMNLIGFFCLAWALLACDQDEGKDNPGVSFPDYGEVLAFPGAEDMGGIPQVAERVKYIK